MSEITEVDIPAVNNSSDRLKSIAADLGTALSNLQHRLEAVDGCWGDDEGGKKFAANYVPQADAVLEGSKLSHDGMKTVAENLRFVATEFGRLDEYGADKLVFEDK